ncbi:MAG: hypothetical protein ABS69_05960 [Nitrosomonadales bacterium SCN 54-20]|nr:MAG: hypothetical protein ABS69_05960 [Nitrosomonadales bacterium SCN 54-20]
MSIGESLHTKSMGGSIRVIDKGTDGTAPVDYCQGGPGSDSVWKTGCSIAVRISLFCGVGGAFVL